MQQVLCARPLRLVILACSSCVCFLRITAALLQNSALKRAFAFPRQSHGTRLISAAVLYLHTPRPLHIADDTARSRLLGQHTGASISMSGKRWLAGQTTRIYRAETTSVLTKSCPT